MRLSSLIVCCVLTLTLGLAVTLALRQRNDQLRAQIARLRTMRPVPTVATLTQPRVGSGEPLAAQIATARRELAQLEMRDQQNAETRAPDLTPPGLTPLENLHNAGQQTPGDAVQTLLWATFRGDDRALTNALLLEPEARAKAAGFLATLPESAREKLPTPESFAALFLAEGLTNVTAVRIGDATAIDPDNATIRVEGIIGRDLQLPARLTSHGWQIVVGEKQVDWAIARLRAAPAK
jgi:hypothetical protein